MRPNNLPALTSEELARSGVALFGANWRAEMAGALGLSDDTLIRAVEKGRLAAPSDWRARLIAIAQDVALNAMETAGALLWFEHDQTQRPACAQSAALLV